MKKHAWMMLALLTAPVASAQTLTVAEFIELSGDPDTLAEAIEQMPDQERVALSNAVTNAFQESYRTALEMETTVRELERLKLLQTSRPHNPLVEQFLSLEPRSREQNEFIDRLSDAERETLAADIEHQIQDDLRLAKEVELVVMEEELLLKRMAANPVSANDRQCDPGSMCRAGCRTRWASCATDVAQIASDCAAEAKRVFNRCALTPSKITTCLGNNLINLGVCSAQRTANSEKCGVANMDCQNCCASFSSGTVPIAMCMAHFTNVSLDSTLPPMQ